MGCGGSKDEVMKEQQNQKIMASKKPEENKDEKDDIDIQVVKPGKNIPISLLDQITNKNLLNKTTDRSHDESFDLKKVQKSETVYENIEKNEMINEKPNPDNFVGKSKTIAKFSHENHPHEFDFSFIEEKPKESIPNDLLTDEVLKEMSELS